MSDGVEQEVIKSKEKLMNLMSIKIQLDEQETLEEFLLKKVSV